MTHPTTEPNIRERLARALVKRQRMRWEEATEVTKYRAFTSVDTIVAELEKPSEGMIDMGQARTFTRATVLKIWQAMIQHIRDGGK